MAIGGDQTRSSRRNRNVSDSPNHQSATALVAADLPYGTWMQAGPSWPVEPWLPWLAGKGDWDLYVGAGVVTEAIVGQRARSREWNGRWRRRGVI
ncbi:hypothetical protein RJZ90_005300 [Blastomyces dermatitidis]